ncbi:hypothetical protein L198_04824 [Cryptococcus wingfieldii CBS 7118]|uniref:Uncharacterized protein n=1 Tax=Cryptococcus wingfieldii CBS 7118 TaxID=1295528 RepID=A0A1E3J1E1_9TREE|nr:hypothetical protein L198_04824 [Cryptococcus wingfieldii CBS 7118]ODN94683.1 hypothetical protein L198_04824 [Cryptococcus wingfieldii CBS 7118]
MSQPFASPLSTLDPLPPEIIQVIFGHLIILSQGSKALASRLSRTSKHFLSLISPQLYRRLSLCASNAAQFFYGLEGLESGELRHFDGSFGRDGSGLEGKSLAERRLIWIGLVREVAIEDAEALKACYKAVKAIVGPKPRRFHGRTLFFWGRAKGEEATLTLSSHLCETFGSANPNNAPYVFPILYALAQSCSLVIDLPHELERMLESSIPAFHAICRGLSPCVKSVTINNYRATPFETKTIYASGFFSFFDSSLSGGRLSTVRLALAPGIEQLQEMLHIARLAANAALPEVTIAFDNYHLQPGETKVQIQQAVEEAHERAEEESCIVSLGVAFRML